MQARRHVTGNDRPIPFPATSLWAHVLTPFLGSADNTETHGADSVQCAWIVPAPVRLRSPHGALWAQCGAQHLKIVHRQQRQWRRVQRDSLLIGSSGILPLCLAYPVSVPALALPIRSASTAWLTAHLGERPLPLYTSNTAPADAACPCCSHGVQPRFVLRTAQVVTGFVMVLLQFTDLRTL